MRKFLVILMMLTVLLIIIGGCSVSRKPAPSPMTPDRSPAPAQDTTPRAHTIATKLANAAERVDGVKSASVVVSGSTALVGLEIEPDVETNKTDEIKQKVAERVKRADSIIMAASVTTDPNLITRLRKIAEGIKAGKPISSFSNELAEITRRMEPRAK
ncbi:MAG: YhcN/YlaJ family sporulation lipoprotein [Tepidanaerobacteraceae bacterium]|jgi:YhcN/YlaJ family sporulation lipoprotein